MDKDQKEDMKEEMKDYIIEDDSGNAYKTSNYEILYLL
jgi:hypothetical protein